MSNGPELGPGAFKIIIRSLLESPSPPSFVYLKAPCMSAEIIRTLKGEVHVGGSASEIANQAGGRDGGAEAVDSSCLPAWAHSAFWLNVLGTTC